MRYRSWALTAGLLFASQAVSAMDEQTFAACLATIGNKAQQQGVSASVVKTSLDGVSFNARVIELDRRQPEFTTSFADYINRRVTTERVILGRQLLLTHRDLLDKVAAEFGVPAQYLIAFWGLETNYGSFFGRMSVLDSLATLACDERRSDYFTGELIAALRIIDEGAISPERMEGSWAGAMGHVQFMPSVFLQYAVDYDGDGRRDLWGSLPDAMASAGNFLRGIGWQTGQRWGREVRLPENFAHYHEAGLHQRKPLAEWATLGIRRADGAPLPPADLDASLLVPTGHQGPAFLVYDNFHVIMRWNRSEFYALSVGLLADRVAGGGGLHRPPPEDVPRLSRAQVKQLQESLTAAGFDSGGTDGILGPATRRAISAWQHANERVADGFPDASLLRELGVLPES